MAMAATLSAAPSFSDSFGGSITRLLSARPRAVLRCRKNFFRYMKAPLVPNIQKRSRVAIGSLEVRSVLIAKGGVSTSEAPLRMAGETPRQSMRVPRADHLVALPGAETILPLPERSITTVTSVRSTLLSSSLQAVRERSLVDAYTQALPTRYHDQVLRTLSPVWLPIDAAMAHYRAMESLRLSEDQVVAIGRSVGDRLHGTFLGTLVRGARHAGVTPWSVAGKVERVWSRVFEGGAIGVVKLGPKEALVSVRGLRLLSVDYFRAGFQGVLCAGVETIARKCYVRETGHALGPDEIDLVASWV